MAAEDREEVFEVTVPAGTKKIAPLKTATRFNPGTVIHIEIQIPDGTAGFSGVRIAASGTQLIPTNTGAWFISNDEIIRRDIEGWPNTGSLEVEAYNEDINPHTYRIRYGIVENSEPAAIVEQGGAAPIAIGSSGEALTVPEAGSLPEEGKLPGPGPEPTPEGGEPPSPPTPEGEKPEPPSPEPGETPSPEPPTEAEGTEPPEAEPAEPPPTPPGPEPPAEEGEPGPGGVEAPPDHGARAKAKRKHTARTRPKHITVTEKAKVVHTDYPAGGWLPKGARFDKKRIDQGQDFITDWNGVIQAPGQGVVTAILHDRAYPVGFGPSYCVIKITTGRFAGHEWYVGHCTATVKVGQHVDFGDPVARANQGKVENGGWVEIGVAIRGNPANTPMGEGAKYASLFTTVERREVHHIKVPVHSIKRRKPDKHKPEHVSKAGGVKAPGRRHGPKRIPAKPKAPEHPKRAPHGDGGHGPAPARPHSPAPAAGPHPHHGPKPVKHEAVKHDKPAYRPPPPKAPAPRAPAPPPPPPAPPRRPPEKHDKRKRR